MNVNRRVVLAVIGGTAGAIVAGSELLAMRARAAAARRGLYNCEGCEAALERPRALLSPVVTLAGPHEPGQRMILTGRVLTADGGRPASDVIVYAHHTNAAGRYGDGKPDTEWSRRHGRLRGWALTGTDGRYTFDTIKPAPYPGRDVPAHIHLFVAEPGKRPYYIDDVVFAGEFGVTPTYRAKQEFRGGSGIVALGWTGDGRLLAHRDIRLERHPA